MIQVTPTTPIFVHTGFIDFRKGIDGLCGVCKYELSQDPMSGALFVFRSRNMKSLKILVYDGQGFWVFHKRLSRGQLKWWPNTDARICYELLAQELYVLIWNGSLNEISLQKNWKDVDKKRILS